MTTYTPTDEQMEALTQVVVDSAEQWDTEYDPDWDYIDEGMKIADVVSASPAFQAIVRAAVDEAVKDLRAERDEAIGVASRAVRGALAAAQDRGEVMK